MTILDIKDPRVKSFLKPIRVNHHDLVSDLVTQLRSAVRGGDFAEASQTEIKLEYVICHPEEYEDDSPIWASPLIWG